MANAWRYRDVGSDPDNSRLIRIRADAPRAMAWARAAEITFANKACPDCSDALVALPASEPKTAQEKAAMRPTTINSSSKVKARRRTALRPVLRWAFISN